ncbi:MAG: type IV pilus modification PilV family protein [Blastocatellia bacterium]
MFAMIIDRATDFDSGQSERPTRSGAADAAENGFSYLDVLIATTLLMVGVMALLGAMTTAVTVTSQSQQQALAKQVATSTMESIFSARDVGAATFAQVANNANNGLPGGNLPGGIFVTNSNPVYPLAGVDGIYGTADDSAGQTAIPQMTRTIAITDISTPNNANNLRQIVVSVSYKYSNLTFSQSVTSYMANYQTLNPGTSGN